MFWVTATRLLTRRRDTRIKPLRPGQSGSLRSILQLRRTCTYKQECADGSEERNTQRIPHRHDENRSDRPIQYQASKGQKSLEDD